MRPKKLYGSDLHNIKRCLSDVESSFYRWRAELGAVFVNLKYMAVISIPVANELSQYKVNIHRGKLCTFVVGLAVHKEGYSLKVTVKQIVQDANT